MKVDTTPVITGNRKSVRITTDSTFTREHDVPHHNYLSDILQRESGS